MARLDTHFLCTATNGAIFIEHVPEDPNTYLPQTLEISFHRTIRVPDNATVSQLPPDLGAFPLSKVQDYAHALPPEMRSQGGLFMPMYQKEAMWIKLTALTPFMIKIYAGGVNVVSGEHSAESIETKMRRLSRYSSGRDIQDYVVTPDQLWLDGIATSPGVVRQFVAMPLGEGFSIETQLTGKEVVGGLQLEITPSMPRKYPKSDGYYVSIVDITGKKHDIGCDPSDKITTLKETIQDVKEIAVAQQRLIYHNKQLEAERTLSDYNIPKGATIYLVLRLRGGGPGNPMPRMGLAAGGEIVQGICPDKANPERWCKSSTLSIPVHLLNSQMFKQVTGKKPPPCPIRARHYAAVGLPFFELPESPSTISGSFGAVKSANAIEQERGISKGAEPSIKPRLVRLSERGRSIISSSRVDMSTLRDPGGLLNPSGPLREVRTLRDLEQEICQL